MSKLVVRAYNVGFGDAILITVPDKNAKTGKETIRNILIDVGNLAVGKGSGHTVFDTVIKDIKKRLDGKNLDLYILTHEHYDHITGLYDAYKKYTQRLDIEYSWLSASCEPNYYARHPAAKRRKELIDAHYKGLRRFLAASNNPKKSALTEILANNDPKKTKERLKFLQKEGKALKKTSYVYADMKLKKGIHHPFEEAKLKVLAPEKDTSCYPVGLQPLPLTLNINTGTTGEPHGTNSAHPIPPTGVDIDAFNQLIERRKLGIVSDILAIDKAANNTSIVFSLEWREWRLLFAGDAENASWETMERLNRELEHVHFLKIGHHGSINGSPDQKQLLKILPEMRPDSRKRVALLSTCHGTNFSDVPHRPTLDRIEQLCDCIISTESVLKGRSVEVTFHG